MEKRVCPSLWSKALAGMCVVAWRSFMRRNRTVVSCIEVDSFKFSGSSHSFCALRSHSKSVKASGSKWVLNQALCCWLGLLPAVCSLMAPAAVSGPASAEYLRVGWECRAGRVLTQHLSPGSPFALSCTPKSQRGVLIQVHGHCDH